VERWCSRSLRSRSAKRYDRLCAELFAWNALESSVALALPASVILLIFELAD